MPGTFAYAVATNTVTVTGGTSGLPADFASFVAADRAGTGTSLLAAWAPTSNTKVLTYQVRPVELLALLISFVVAGKTAETDYIFITGTDWLGAAQTEAIDVSAGNVTYITTKYFRTITNIDCSDNAAGGGTVWADGTVAVTQPIWGVIWDKGDGQYQLDAAFNIGDGSTSTYFADVNKAIFLPPIVNALLVRNNATLRLGEVVGDEANKVTTNGCYIRGNIYNAYMISGGGSSNAIVQLYGCLIDSANIRTVVGGFNNASCRVWNCRLHGVNLNQLYKGDYYNWEVDGGYTGVSYPYGGTYNNVSINSCPTAILISSSATITNAIAKLCTKLGSISSTGDLTLIDATSDIWSFIFGSTGKVYRKYTVNIHIVKPDGTSLEGATVTLTSPALGVVWTTATHADGKIYEADTVTLGRVSSRGYYDSAHGDTIVDYGPHTLTITAAGYQDYTDVITLDRKMDLEVALLAPAGGVSPTNLGLVPLGIKQVAI